MLTFRGLSVSHVRACAVLKRQKTSSRFILRTIQSIVYRLTSVNPFLPKFYPKVTYPRLTPVDLSVGDIPWQTATELENLEIEQWPH